MTYNKISEPSRPVYLLAKLVNAVRQRYRKWSQWFRYTRIYPKFKQVGEEVILDEDIYINKPENISIGDRTFIGADVTLNAIAEINFGEDCGIASGSYFMTWNHRIGNQTVELRATGKESEPINVGDGAWVGYDAIVLSGVNIGTGGVVAAGAVVTDDVPDWTVVAGTPAEPIAERTSDGLETVNNPRHNQC